MTHETAVEIVKDWLGPDGWIGKAIYNLNILGINILRNIAPVAPEKTLEAIERAANGPEGGSFTSRREFLSHRVCATAPTSGLRSIVI